MSTPSTPAPEVAKQSTLATCPCCGSGFIQKNNPHIWAKVSAARTEHDALAAENNRLRTALEEIIEGAVRHSSCEHRITNYSLNIARAALAGKAAK